MLTERDVQEMLRGFSPRARQRIAAWIYAHDGEREASQGEPSRDVPSQLEVSRESSRVAEAVRPYRAVWRNRHPTVDEYLRDEEVSDSRYEYFAGEIFAMSGVSRAHDRISVNVISTLAPLLRGSRCRVHGPEFKVWLKVGAHSFLYYPDVTVSCGDAGFGSHWLTQPKLIFEVLSPSTERTDRREKALHYRAADSFEEYVLIAQDEREVTVQRRCDDWVSEVLTEPGAVLELKSLGLSVPLSELYAEALVH